MKTVLVDGVPVRIRADMPFLEEMYRQEGRDALYQLGFDEASEEHAGDFDNGYKEGYDEGESALAGRIQKVLDH
jgi:hypothetical protein